MNTPQQTTNAFLAIIFIRVGSLRSISTATDIGMACSCSIGTCKNWGTAATIDEAVAAAGSACSRDWGSIFTFTDKPVNVNVYALPSLDADWHASDEGLLVGDSTERGYHLARALETREVVLTNED